MIPVYPRRFVVWLPFLFLLAACAGSPGGRVPAEFTVRNDGVGRIGMTTPFNVEMIGQSFPGLEIGLGRHDIEGADVPYITVSSRGRVLMDVYPDDSGKRVSSVLVMSSQLADAQGVRIGGSFHDVYGGRPPGNCLPGWGDMRGRVFCPARGAPNVLYVFAGDRVPDKAQMNGALPPVDQLRNWRVSQIVWSNPAISD